MKRLVLAVAAVLAMLPANNALADPEPTLVSTVASSDEGYVDDALDLPTSEQDLPVRALFGDRLGEVWIDRSVSPSALKVAVVDLTADDVKAVADLSGNNPRVVVHAVAHSSSELRSWKRATQEVLQRHSLQAVGYEVRGREGRLIVGTETALPVAVMAEILAIVPADAIAFTLSSPGLFLHDSRGDYPPHEGGLKMAVNTAKVVAGGMVKSGEGTCTSAFSVRGNSTGIYYGTSAGHCSASGGEVYIGTRYVSDVGMNPFYEDDPVMTDSMRYPISPEHANPLVNIGNDGHRVVRGTFLDHELMYGTRVCFQGAASDGNNCGNVRVIRDDTKMGDPRWPTKEIGLDYCINFPAAPGDSGGPVYQVRSDGSARAAGIVSSMAEIELQSINPGTGMATRDAMFGPPEPKTGMCFTSVGQMEARLGVHVLQG